MDYDFVYVYLAEVSESHFDNFNKVHDICGDIILISLD